MANLTFTQLEALWDSQAPPALKVLAPVMAAIALAESGGRPTAINPNDNNGTQSSYGLWQISNGTHSPPAPNWADPSENAKLAVQKMESQGLSAWGTWKSGAYKTYLAQNNAADTSGALTQQPLPGAPGSSSSPGGPLADLTGAVSSAGTLLGDAAKALDWVFHMFKPGQGWRIAFGAGSVLAFYGGVRSWMAATSSEDGSAALPLAVLLFALSALAAFMTLRQWPQPGGKAITPGAYAVDVLEGKAPAPGAAPASDAPAIEVGLAAILALWGASKAAQGLSGLGGLLAGLGALLRGGAAAGAAEVP